MSSYDQLMLDLFSTALEGGVGYWSHISRYHWSKLDVDGFQIEDHENFYALILENDGEEMPEHRIDRSVMVLGYALATDEWLDEIRWSAEPPPTVHSDDMNDEWDWDFDAGDADVIVQLGLFGEVRYG